jgi:hypothetical protein
LAREVSLHQLDEEVEKILRGGQIGRVVVNLYAELNQLLKIGQVFYRLKTAIITIIEVIVQPPTVWLSRNS